MLAWGRYTILVADNFWGGSWGETMLSLDAFLYPSRISCDQKHRHLIFILDVIHFLTKCFSLVLVYRDLSIHCCLTSLPWCGEFGYYLSCIYIIGDEFVFGWAVWPFSKHNQLNPASEALIIALFSSSHPHFSFLCIFCLLFKFDSGALSSQKPSMIWKWTVLLCILIALVISSHDLMYITNLFSVCLIFATRF